jgi:hypothetical protein
VFEWVVGEREGHKTTDELEVGQKPQGVNLKVTKAW